METKNTKKNEVAAKFVANFKAENLSLTGVIKNSLQTSGFSELLTSLNIDVNKVTAKNVGYFIPSYNEDKSTFTANNLVTYLKRMSQYLSTGNKLVKKDSLLFCIGLDMAKLAKQSDKLNSIVVELLNVDVTKFSDLQKYLHENNLRSQSEKLNKISENYKFCSHKKTELLNPVE